MISLNEFSGRLYNILLHSWKYRYPWLKREVISFKWGNLHVNAEEVKISNTSTDLATGQ